LENNIPWRSILAHAMTRVEKKMFVITFFKKENFLICAQATSS
jgi:hypothetical protein